MLTYEMIRSMAEQFAKADFATNENFLFLKKLKESLVKKKISNSLADEIVSVMNISLPVGFMKEPDSDIIVENMATGIHNFYRQSMNHDFGAIFIVNFCRKITIEGD